MVSGMIEKLFALLKAGPLSDDINGLLRLRRSAIGVKSIL